MPFLKISERNQTPPRQDRFGFTAIEALAATTLASLMLVSVLGVLGTLSHGQKVLLAKSQDHASWHKQLTHQLQWDLENSRSMFVGTNQLVLKGFAGRDFASGRPTGRPTRVEYFLDLENAGGILLRRESHLDVLTNTNWRAEVVCVGVQGFVVGQGGAISFPTQPIGNNAENNAKLQPIPDQVTVNLTASLVGKAPKDQASWQQEPSGIKDRLYQHTFILR